MTTGGGPSGWALLLDALLLDAGYNSAVAMVGSAALGAAAGVVGVFAMLRRRSLMGDAIAHAMFPGLCIAFMIGTAMGWNARSLGLLMVGAGATGVLGALTVRGLRGVRRFNEDLGMAIVLAVFFGFGTILLSHIVSSEAGNQAGLGGLLLGQAASMLTRDAQLIAVIGLVCVVVCAALFKELRLLCFDDRFAQATGLPVRGLDLVLMGLILLITVIGLRSVGLVLVVAMLIIPAATARFWTNRLWLLCVLAGVWGSASGYVGAGLSRVLREAPTGATIVLVAGAGFVVSLLLSPRRGLLAMVGRRLSLRLRIASDHVLRHALEDRGLEADVEGVTGESVPVRGVLLRLLMKRRGLVRPEAGRLVLTAKGVEEARRLTDAHTLWERYLEIYAGFGADRVHNPADLVEHVLSPELTAALRERVERAEQAPGKGGDGGGGGGGGGGR